MITRQQHIENLLSLLTRACRQYYRHDKAGQSTDNDKQQIIYLQQLIGYSL